MPEDRPVLSVTGLNVFYASSHVLQQVSLSLGQEPLAIVGRNGMGKTTLCNAVMGLVPTADGEIRFRGERLTGLSPDRRARRGIGYVPQGRRIFPSLNVDEHLRLVEGRRPGGSWTRPRIYDVFPALAERRRNAGDRLSGGEQQMLALARALLLAPELLVLDEPTEGLAPAIVDQVVALLRVLTAEGIALLLVEQNLSVALAVARQVAIMVNGRIVETCSSAQLAGDASLRQRYLGIAPADARSETRRICHG